MAGISDAAASEGPFLVRKYCGSALGHVWTAPWYDASDIRVPVLLVHAERDRDGTMASTQDFFLSLKRAQYRRWVEIGEGTHMVLLEKNRLQAFDAISQFLAEDYAQGAPSRR